jgi:hypothetical protein
VTAETPAVEFIRALTRAWDCCGTCAGGVLAQRDRPLLDRLEAAEAKVARAEALADEWDQIDGDGYAAGDGPDPFTRTDDLRAALSDDQPATGPDTHPQPGSPANQPTHSQERP